MTTLEQAVYNYLVQNASGESSAKTSDNIYVALSNLLSEEGRTQEQVRMIIGRLVKNHGKLIGSCRHGFYVITNKNEVNKTINDYQRRSDSIRIRIQKLKNQWNLDNPNNLIV